MMKLTIDELMEKRLKIVAESTYSNPEEVATMILDHALSDNDMMIQIFGISPKRRKGLASAEADNCADLEREINSIFEEDE